ncbi:hypothetical protein [Cupriavidus nantongensis]|uniref:TraP protein n=1 Tax=Cupriavidus nantongensis TaxID=1796606 RepID=A0A142JKI4_9BURK|nr:hypothetical protein [Cupriavidus nantongensis]AMR78596.1 hypothetical protein A2G96_13060 [Cupriavidus nantongensis]
MSQTNHFDANLETTDHDDAPYDPSQDEITDVPTSEKPKRKLPANFLIYGAVAFAVLGFWGYKKMSKPSSPAAFSSSAPMSEGGMMGALQPNGEGPAPDSFSPSRQLQHETAPQGFVPNGTGPAMQSDSFAAAVTGSAASIGSASEVSAASLTASAVNAPTEIGSRKEVPKDSDRREASDTDAAILAQLKAQTAQLEDMGKRLAALENRRVEVQPRPKATRATKPLSDEDRAREKAAGVVRAKATRARSNPRDEIQLGYKIKQVIPGQAWLEDETGKQYVKTKGDKLGGSEIVEIDADKYIVRTTAGVIR